MYIQYVGPVNNGIYWRIDEQVLQIMHLYRSIMFC